MAKSDYFCANCRQLSGTDRRGNPTERFECGRCGLLCQKCIRKVWVKPKFRCENCEGAVIHQEFNIQSNSWETV
jgi:predicted SprT family Zn-dependent metalloprotease